MLCYRCGGHVKDGSDKCPSCGQPFALGLKPGSIAGFGTGSRRGRAAIEGAPYGVGDAVGNRFQVKDHLGAGPLGWVFRALDTESGESVALKVLSPRFLQLPEEQAAFLSELERTRALDHGNVARTIASGLDGTRPWIATQLLDGLTLRRIMDLRRQKGQAFALHEIEPIVAQIAAALDASPVPHGDLKPDNVVVLPDLLKLTDFGLALCLPRAPFVAAQRAGGVQRYFAPEMLAGQALGGRADVFSLGAMLGEMLGGAPFDAQLEAKIRAAQVSVPVEQVFLRAVAPRPEERYASAGDLSAALSEAIHGTPPPSEDDDVVIEHAQTDPRVRIARALAAQDAEKAVRSQAQAKDAKARAESKSAPELPPSLQLSLTPLPPLSLTPLPPLSVPPLSMPPLALAPFSAPPPIAASEPAPQAKVAPLPPAELPDASSGSKPAAEERSNATEPKPRPETAREPAPATAPLVQPSRPQSAIETPTTPLRKIEPGSIAAEGPRGHKSSELARVAASVGATPELLTAETAVRFAPTAPASAPPPEAVSPAPAAPIPHGADAQESARDDELESDDAPGAPLVSDPPPSSEDAGGRGKRRGRGRKGRREEAKARRQGEGPESAKTSAEARAAAETQELLPLTLASPAVEPVKKLPSIGGTPSIEKPAALVLEKPAEPLPERAGARPAARPSAAPSFGALASEKRGLSVPTIAIGVVILVAVAIFAWSQLSGHGAAEKPALPDSTPSAPATPPPPAPAPAKADATPPAPAAPAPAPSEPVKPEPAESANTLHAKEPAELPPSREFEDKASKGGKKSFLERLRERRDASKHSSKDEAPAKSAPHAESAPESTAPVPTADRRPAAPPPTPVAAAPAHADSAGGIAGTGDDDLLVSRDPEKNKRELAAVAGVAPGSAAPAAPAPAEPCAEGMKLIPGGSAHVGTDASDDMRNFGDRSPATVQLKAYCIDLYEWPNASGKLPKIAAGYSEADSSCKRAGKRLCSEDEWEKACKGPAELRFPYGNAFDADACNTQDKSTNPRKVSASGSFATCRSGYGVYDLSGNAAEWTQSPFEGNSPDRAVKGGNATRPGFDDRCSSRRRMSTGTHDISVGFRCCADSK